MAAIIAFQLPFFNDDHQGTKYEYLKSWVYWINISERRLSGASPSNSYLISAESSGAKVAMEFLSDSSLVN